MPEELNIAIAGGGIGGLTLALTLHRAGFTRVIYERADVIAELGVGINILPHAIRHLVDLGLLEALDSIGIRTRELIYKTTAGQDILGEPRGTWAGYDVPQFSIHRGKLQKCLADAVRDRLGYEAYPMYPVGSNGASQAILDAVAIARHLTSDVVVGLGAYDQERRPATADIVRANRKGVIDVIEERAPDGFAALDDVAKPGEVRAIVGDYQTMAGYRLEQVNRE